MDIFSSYATDEVKENDGVWFNLPGSGRVRVGRTQSTRYQKALAKAFETLQKARRTEDNDAAEEVLLDLAADHLLLGWEGITYKKEELAYNHENSKMLLKIKDFYAQVMKFAEDFDAFKVDAEEEAGND